MIYRLVPNLKHHLGEKPVNRTKTHKNRTAVRLIEAKLAIPIH